LLGEEPGALLNELAQKKPLPTVPPTVPVAFRRLAQAASGYREAELEWRRKPRASGVARADLFPKILLNGSAAGSNRACWSELGAGNFFAIGPAITLPIFTGGKIRANIEAQKQRTRSGADSV